MYLVQTSAKEGLKKKKIVGMALQQHWDILFLLLVPLVLADE